LFELVYQFRAHRKAVVGHDRQGLRLIGWYAGGWLASSQQQNQDRE